MGTGGSRGEPHNEFRTACKTSRPTTPGKCGALDGAGTTARHIESMICASKSQRSGRGRQNFENSPTAQTTRILPAPIRSTPTALPSPPPEGALLALLSACVPVTALGLFGTAHPLRLCRCPPRRGGHQPPKKYFFKKGHFRCFALCAKLAAGFPPGNPGCVLVPMFCTQCETRRGIPAGNTRAFYPVFRV